MAKNPPGAIFCYRLRYASICLLAILQHVYKCSIGLHLFSNAVTSFYCSTRVCIPSLIPWLTWHCPKVGTDTTGPEGIAYVIIRNRRLRLAVEAWEDKASTNSFENLSNQEVFSIPAEWPQTHSTGNNRHAASKYAVKTFKSFILRSNIEIRRGAKPQGM